MDKNNKGYAFYVPQGGFVVFKTSKPKKEEGGGQKSEEIRVSKIDEVLQNLQQQIKKLYIKGRNETCSCTNCFSDSVNSLGFSHSYLSLLFTKT